MNCPNCGAKNEPGARFCAECGAPLESQSDLVSPPPEYEEDATVMSPAFRVDEEDKTLSVHQADVATAAETERSFTSAGEAEPFPEPPLPPPLLSSPPSNGGGSSGLMTQRNIIIAVVVLLVLCCCCSLLGIAILASSGALEEMDLSLLSAYLAFI